MQDIKTFRAGSMQEALDLVRAEVGPDAVILHTKQIEDRSYLPWKKAKPVVEITVRVDEQPKSSRLSQSIATMYRNDSASDNEYDEDEETFESERRTPSSNKSLAMQLLANIGKEEDELDLASAPAGRSQLSAQTARPAPRPGARSGAQRPPRESMLTRPLTTAQRNHLETTNETPTVSEMAEPITRSEARPPRELKSQVASQSQRQPQRKVQPTSRPQPGRTQPKSQQASPPRSKSQPGSKPQASSKSQAGSRPQSIAARLSSGDLEPTSVPPVRAEPINSPPPAPETTARTEPGSASYVDHDFANRLANIERMLLNMGKQNPIVAMRELPNSLFNLYTKLIDVDVAEDVARELVFDFKKQCRPQDLTIEGRTDALLEGLIEKQFRCSGPIQVPKGRRKVVALVGATGVGKTTTIAKLAANFKLKQGLKMGLVTVDTYRIAAVEQLRTYAEIMDLPMKVVTDAQEMRTALDELQGLDLVLIDTGGRSPKDEPKIKELKALLQEARADEVHLVLNLTASRRSLESMAQEFAAAGTTSMVLTKLDETEELGPLLNIARKVPLPVSYLTTGQAVPEDIEPATAARMKRLLLEQDVVGQSIPV